MVVAVAVAPREHWDASCLLEIERKRKRIQFCVVTLIERDERRDTGASTTGMPPEPRRRQNDERGGVLIVCVCVSRVSVG